MLHREELFRLLGQRVLKEERRGLFRVHRLHRRRLGLERADLLGLRPVHSLGLGGLRPGQRRDHLGLRLEHRRLLVGLRTLLVRLSLRGEAGLRLSELGTEPGHHRHLGRHARRLLLRRQATRRCLVEGRLQRARPILGGLQCLLLGLLLGRLQRRQRRVEGLRVLLGRRGEGRLLVSRVGRALHLEGRLLVGLERLNLRMEVGEGRRLLGVRLRERRAHRDVCHRQRGRPVHLGRPGCRLELSLQVRTKRLELAGVRRACLGQPLPLARGGSGELRLHPSLHLRLGLGRRAHQSFGVGRLRLAELRGRRLERGGLVGLLGGLQGGEGAAALLVRRGDRGGLVGLEALQLLERRGGQLRLGLALRILERAGHRRLLGCVRPLEGGSLLLLSGRPLGLRGLHGSGELLAKCDDCRRLLHLRDLERRLERRLLVGGGSLERRRELLLCSGQRRLLVGGRGLPRGSEGGLLVHVLRLEGELLAQLGGHLGPSPLHLGGRHLHRGR